MRKFFFTSLLLFVSIFALPTQVFAQFGLDTTAQHAQYEQTNIYSVLSTVIALVLSFTGVVFLAIMFYAGLCWMTARGNEEFAAKAKEAMFAAIMGLILVAAAYGISTFIFSKITS